MTVERASHHKHPGMYLDEILHFKMQIEIVLCKVNKRISVIKKLRHTLQRKSLLTIYKAFLRPHIDYGDIDYDRPSNESFNEKLESVQYKTALAITGAIQGTSRKKNFMVLGLESLKSRKWFRRLCCMFKIMKIQAPEYLTNLIPKRNQNSRNIYIPSYNCRTEYFKSSFFPASLEEWLHLDPSIRNSETTNAFKQKLLTFIRPLENSIFNIVGPEGLELLTRLRLGLSHLNKHQTENTSHYLLHCHHNTPFRTALTNSVKTFIVDFVSLSDSKKVEILLYGDSQCDDNQNNSILSASLNYIKKTKGFDCSLFT